MEAYILTDKVLTKQHMDHQDSKPKYIKKYDLSSGKSKKRIRTVASRKALTPIIFINAPRTKDLLSQISKPIETSLTTSLQRYQKIDRYFTATSQSFRETQKKNKVGLLIRTMEPQSQHYDAGFNSVNRRAPSWAFLPMKKQKTMPEQSVAVEPVSKPQKSKQKKHWQRPSKPKPFEFGQFLEKEEQKLSMDMKNRGEVDSRLQYSTSDLGRCTVQIFKKYNLDKDSYFKRMLTGLDK